MAKAETESLFAPGKARWLLEGGLETLDAGERQMLLVMAEMAELQGRELSAEEQEVVTRLRTDAAGDYDAKDVAKKVKKLIKGKRKKGAGPFTLPPGLARLKEERKK